MLTGLFFIGLIAFLAVPATLISKLICNFLRKAEKYIDEYIAKYGDDNTTGIPNMEIALFVNKARKEKDERE